MSAGTQRSSRETPGSLYTDGGYLAKNPLWHVDESPFKAHQLLCMVQKNKLHPRTICEAGCGAGEVLRLLQKEMDPKSEFWGYDISPQAHDLCQTRSNKTLHFLHADITQQEGVLFDLLLVLDVFEHVEDYFGFLRGLRTKGILKIFHIPLDLSVQAVIRRRGLLKRRDLYGHLHYFTKETALAALRDTGYELIDYCYTPRCIDLAKGVVQKMAIWPRKVSFAFNEDWTVRILGGYSLLVLAK